MDIIQKIEFHENLIYEANKAIILCKKTIDEQRYVIDVAMERKTLLEDEQREINEENEENEEE